MKVHKHDVTVAGFEFYCLAGVDLQAAENLAHLHDAAIHFHLMSLEASR